MDSRELAHQEYIDGIVSEYRELEEKVKNADDSLFPEWLFQSSMNDFDDNYYEQSFAEDVETAEVRKLKRRYNDFFEWQDAMDVYNSYMGKMEEKYGSIDFVEKAAEAGFISEPIPSKPKLKSSRKNRQFLRSGVFPSRRMKSLAISEDEILAIARQELPGMMGDDVDESEVYKKPPKSIQKRFEEINKAYSSEERRRNLYRSVSNNMGANFIIEFFNNAKNGVYSSNGKPVDDEDKSIVDMVEEAERTKYIPQEILDAEKRVGTTQVVGNRLVSSEDLSRTEIYKELYEEGYDIFHNLGRSGMNKNAIKMIRSSIGATEPVTKKEMKQMKKQAKKEKERMKRKSDATAVLERTLLGNKIGYQQDSQGNLTFHLRDLMFNDDD